MTNTKKIGGLINEKRHIGGDAQAVRHERKESCEKSKVDLVLDVAVEPALRLERAPLQEREKGSEVGRGAVGRAVETVVKRAVETDGGGKGVGGVG